jgi:hypothetical protein
MPSYVVTGGSRGIGVSTSLNHPALDTLTSIFQFGFVRQLSESPENVVVTIVRNKATTESKIASEIPGRKNIFVLQGDLTDEESLKVSQTANSPLLASEGQCS